jgi:hypothetical protein
MNISVIEVQLQYTGPFGLTTHSLTGLNKPRRFLLERQRVTHRLRLRHRRALEQLAKGYVLRGQGQYPIVT